MEARQQQPQAAKIAKLSEGEEEYEKVIRMLEERLEIHDNNRKAAQDKIHEICEGFRGQIDELENRISKELEEKFTLEDSRFQAPLSELRENRTASALQKAKAELLVEQSYEILENKDVKFDPIISYELKAERRIVPELMEMRKPTNVCVTCVNNGIVSVGFTCLNLDEERVLSDNTIVNPVRYKCSLFKKGDEQKTKEYSIDKEDNDSFLFTPDILESETTYEVRVKMIVDDRQSELSEVAEYTTPEFRDCVWKKYSGDANKWLKYSVDEKNPRIATKVNDYVDCTIIGDIPIPFNRVTTWSVKVLKSEANNGCSIFIGAAPYDINQNDNNYDKCGWYLRCYDSTLCSGPPHNYGWKEYGPRKEHGQYVHTGDSVDVVVDTAKGELSFVLNGVNLGVAYEEILLDKPLVPCVILGHVGDSVKLII